MERLKVLEDKLAGVFKDFPALPKNAKDIMVKYWPVVAVVFGLVQLWAAYALWDLLDNYNKVSDFVDSFAQYYPTADIGMSSYDKFTIYLSIAVVLFSGVLMLLAASPLSKKLKKGWDLLFLAIVVQLIYSVITIFAFSGGVGSFIGNLIGATIGFYFLFQIRDYYGKNAAVAASKPKAS